MKSIFTAGALRIHPISESDLQSVFEVYKQCEDFLSLGPVSVASIEMVKEDIEHSKRGNGIFCGISDNNGMIGIIDFIPEIKKYIAFLTLLMIAKPYRYKGLGLAIMNAFEKYLKTRYNSRSLESGVQINNILGINFWKKCGFIIDAIENHLPDRTIAYDMKKEIV